MSLVLLVRTAVVLVLQLLLLGLGARTARLYRTRHFGRRRLRLLLANKPLVGVAVVSVAHSVLTAAWLTRWVHRAISTTPDQLINSVSALPRWWSDEGCS